MAAIRSCDTGQRTTCFNSCQLITGSSRNPPQQTSAETSGKNVDQSKHTCRSRKCTLDLRNFARDSRKDQKGLIKGEDLPLLEQTTTLTHTPFVLEATLAIPWTKLSRRLNLLNGSQLYYKTMNCEEKISAFCSVTMYHSTVASPKENLYLYE